MVLVTSSSLIILKVINSTVGHSGFLSLSILSCGQINMSSFSLEGDQMNGYLIATLLSVSIFSYSYVRLTCGLKVSLPLWKTNISVSPISLVIRVSACGFSVCKEDTWAKLNQKLVL